MNRITLRRLLIGGTLFFTLVPLVLVVSWFDQRGRASTAELATDVLSNVADRLRSDSEVHLQRANDTMNGVAISASVFSRQTDSGPQLIENPARFEALAFALTRLSEDLPYLYVGKSDGSFLGVEQVTGGARVGEMVGGKDAKRRYSLAQAPGDRSVALPADVKDYEPRTRPWYTAAADARTRVFTAVYPSASKKSLIVTLAQPVYDQNQVLKGVFALDVSLASIAEQLRRQRISPRGVALIIDDKGMLVGASTGDDTYKDGPKGLERVSPAASNSPTIKRIVAHMEAAERAKDQSVLAVDESVVRVQGVEGPMLLVQREFNSVLGVRWRLLVAAPEADFTGDADHQRRVALWGILGVAFLCATLAFLFANRLSRRLQTLTTAALSIGRGEVPDATVKTRIAEVHHLSNVLHDAAAQLQSARTQMAKDAQSLQDAHDGLERRVVERTTELAASREEALEAARAKAAFLATMSHEIRTPLNGVVGMSSLLAETQLDVEQRDFLSTIRVSSDQLLGVINDILDFSKIESGKLELEQEPLLLRQVVEEACDIAAPRAREKGLELLIDVPIEPGFPIAVRGDPTRIRQVLINFINNAVKFTERGEVAVQLRVLPPDSTDAIAPEHARIEFRVRDTGIGIPADRVHALFSAFTQVDASTTRKYGGTGLGLAICKRLALAMGGQVGVSSQAGIGSEFWFTIDVPQCSAEVAAELSAAPADAPALSGQSVFVVDDNPTNLRILTRQLSNWGMQVRAFDTVSLALGAMRNGPLPAVVVTDMHMPVVDGVEFARVAKSQVNTASVPLILLSSGVLPVQDPSAALFAARLLKPAREAQLFDALTRCIDPTRADTRAQPLDRSAKRHQTVLVADDNAVNLKVAVSMLSKLGFDSVTAIDGQVALDAVLAARKNPFDLVLMDLNMPNMDGLVSSREIRRLMGAAAPPIVALTAAASAEDRDRCLGAGMCDYLTKPLQLNALAHALERWLPDANAGVSDSEIATNSIAKSSVNTLENSEKTIEKQLPDGDLVLDVARLQEFREFDDADLSMTRGVINVFMADAPGRIEALAVALTGPDLAEVSRCAHALKGAASNVGAIAIQTLCSTLEAQAKAGVAPPDGAAISQRLRDLWPRTQQALGDYSGR